MTNSNDQVVLDPRRYFGSEVGTCIAAELAFNRISKNCKQAKSRAFHADLGFMTMLAGATVATIFSSVADLAWVAIPFTVIYFLSRTFGGVRAQLNNTVNEIKRHRDLNLEFIRETYGAEIDLKPELEALSMAETWQRQNGSLMPSDVFACVYRKTLSDLELRDRINRPDLLVITH